MQRAELAFCVAVAVSLVAGAPVSGAERPTPIHRIVLGRSVEGRPIEAVEVGDPSGQRLLVVGCIHGDEPAGASVAQRLEHLSPKDIDLWIVPVLNPDGRASHSRDNAHGVDLNRNFPWHWRRLKGAFYSGPKPLSEPESQIAFRLIRRLRPQVSIWFHQHLGVVDESGGDVRIESRYAALVGLPLARLPREPGSVVNWENHSFPGTTAFVVELTAGPLSAAATNRYAAAVTLLAPVIAGRPERRHR